MGLVALPCEISKREFDAKLLLAVRLALIHNKASIVGYSNYFHAVCRIATYATLMDKSCSDIMYKGRIEPVKTRGGRVIISDEEGYNNLHLIKESYKARVNSEAAKAIDLYACWGSIDKEFYSDKTSINQKSEILGNCRAALCNELGEYIYAEQIKALKCLYGRFIICSDNFCVEHWRANYNPPKFQNSSEAENIIEQEYNKYRATSKENRDVFARYIEKAAKSFENYNFVIRPHPVARPNWWVDRFWKYRNVHINGIRNVEPWLHASEGLLSMGCTTGLQSLIANKPVIDIDKNFEKGVSIGYARSFTKLRPKSEDEFCEIIQLMQRGRIKDHQMSMDRFEQQWANYNEETINIFAEKINSLHNARRDEYSDEEAREIARYFKSHKIKIDGEKWETQNYKEIKSKVQKASEYWGMNAPKVYKIAEGLFYVRK